MARIDTLLDSLRMEVELSGRSGGDGVYYRNFSFTIFKEDWEIPLECDFDGAIVDFDWFWRCSEKGYTISHPSPDKSFWMRTWGENVLPYGASWRVGPLVENLRNPDRGRKGVLLNSNRNDDPPAVLNYQFLASTPNTLDMTVTMRSCDMANVLTQDVTMCYLLLVKIAKLMDMDPGNMTFNIGDAHVFYESLRITDSYEFDVAL